MRKTLVTMTDDLDPKTEATQTVSFSLDGRSYEIDLNDKNAKKLRDFLDKYVEAGRKVNNYKANGSRRASRDVNGKVVNPSITRVGPGPATVRAWAKSNGYDVPDRGRIPAKVVEAFEAANA